LTDSVPFTSLWTEQPNTRVSRPAGDGQGAQVMHAVIDQRVGAKYFATLGVPLVAGREFDRRDERQGAAATPAILNQTGARELFGTEDPMGRRIREGERSYTVVGLTRDAKSGFVPPKPVATVFLPLTAQWLRQHPAPRAAILVRGTAGRDTLAAVRGQLASLHPNLTVFDMRTMAEDIRRLNSSVEWDSAIYVVLGIFALLLACIGLGGVTVYAVARRRKEIGIRMALGAREHQVQGLVLRESTALVVTGSLLGFGGAVVLSRALSAFSDELARIYDKPADDPFLLFGVPLVLAALALVACYLPARRATKIDPMAALREE
jgi:ABC-type antimicrobial peptide transport system permease subunit